MKKVILSMLSLIGMFLFGFFKSKEGGDVVGKKIKNAFTATDYLTKSRILGKLTSANKREATRIRKATKHSD